MCALNFVAMTLSIGGYVASQFIDFTTEPVNAEHLSTCNKIALIVAKYFIFGGDLALRANFGAAMISLGIIGVTNSSPLDSYECLLFSGGIVCSSFLLVAGKTLESHVNKPFPSYRKSEKKKNI